MPLYTSPPSHSFGEKRRIIPSDFWLLGLRLLMVLPMGYYQLLDQSVKAWKFTWEGHKWALPEQAEAAGLPQPEVVSVALVLILAFSSFALLIGFLSRINAILIAGALVFILVPGLEPYLSSNLTPQAILLYLGMGTILGMAGGGLFSVDGFLWRRRQRAKFAL
jgi:uncharacterized membrane protein YphA (DoxX/SURF4 family)